MILRSLICSLVATSLAGAALAAEPPDLATRLDVVAKAWAHANFEIPDKAAQGAAAERTARAAEIIAQQYPNRAEPLVWQAIALSTEAGADGGLRGLGLAKQARGLLERAEHIDPTALGDGSVYTSLGSLYAQVPGFPVGFGDAAKARSYFRKALAANPRGLDPNFFYGDFLFRQGDYAGAARALETALAAPARPGREIADHGRRAQANALLAQTKAKLRG